MYDYTKVNVEIVSSNDTKDITIIYYNSVNGVDTTPIKLKGNTDVYYVIDIDISKLIRRKTGGNY